MWLFCLRSARRSGDTVLFLYAVYIYIYVYTFGHVLCTDKIRRSDVEESILLYDAQGRYYIGQPWATLELHYYRTYNGKFLMILEYADCEFRLDRSAQHYYR